MALAYSGISFAIVRLPGCDRPQAAGPSPKGSNMNPLCYLHWRPRDFCALAVLRWLVVDQACVDIPASAHAFTTRRGPRVCVQVTC